MRSEYYTYIQENSVEGSGTAHSYVRALDMLGPILKNQTTTFAHHSDIWSIQIPATIEQLYEFILKEQRKKETGIFSGHKPASYWEGGYYSAALGSYKNFLVSYQYIQQHEDRLWKIYKEAKSSSSKLSSELENAEFKEIEKIIPEKDVDFSTKEGKEKLRLTKTRVNQDFFRKMILAEYNTQCCITGLNVPEVLRASHIVAWAEDEQNRMNPANGLCLSATYDAAFDRHLISFDDDYRLILSPSLKEHYTNQAFKDQFLAIEGQKIKMPKLFLPAKRLLARHRDEVIA